MKIALVGNEPAIRAALESVHIPNDLEIIVIDDLEEKKPKYFNPAQPEFLIEPLPFHDYEKKFICKGKHQYREESKVWICQCGRKIND